MEVLFSRFLKSLLLLIGISFLFFLYADKIKAQTPVTKGVAIDVPLKRAKTLGGYVDNILSPGATISTSFPREAKPLIFFESFVELTVMVSLKQAG